VFPEEIRQGSTHHGCCNPWVDASSFDEDVYSTEMVMDVIKVATAYDLTILDSCQTIFYILHNPDHEVFQGFDLDFIGKVMGIVLKYLP
jgi:hypothetical protein